MPKDMYFNSGFAGCSDRMDILRNETVPRDLTNTETIVEVDWNNNVSDQAYVYVDDAGTPAKVKLQDITHPTILQSDWNVDDVTDMSYIRNKPDLSDVILDESFTVTNGVGRAYNGKIYAEGTTLLYIIKDMLTAIDESDIQNVYFGIFDQIPTTKNAFTQYWQRSADQLVSDGFLMTFTTTFQYAVLAVPGIMGGNKSVEVEYIVDQQTGAKIDYTEGLTMSQTADGYKLFYLSAPTTGTFEFFYKFKEV